MPGWRARARWLRRAPSRLISGGKTTGAADTGSGDIARLPKITGTASARASTTCITTTTAAAAGTRIQLIHTFSASCRRSKRCGSGCRRRSMHPSRSRRAQGGSRSRRAQGGSGSRSRRAQGGSRSRRAQGGRTNVCVRVCVFWGEGGSNISDRFLFFILWLEVTFDIFI